MVKPLKPWPEPPVPTPAETPFNVFYAVVIDDNQTKKSMRRRNFTHFVEVIPYNAVTKKESLGESNAWRLSGTPTFFTTKAEARELHDRVETFYQQTKPIEGFEASIKTFRIVESEWHGQWHDDDVCAFRDARRMATGILHYSTVAEQIKKLAGKVLTVLDAAYVNENQNKAVKDLTKNSFRSQLSEIYKTAHEDPDCDSCESEACMKDILD